MAVGARRQRVVAIAATISLALVAGGVALACRRTVRLRNVRSVSSEAGAILFSGRRIAFAPLSPGEARTVTVWGRKSKASPDGGTCVLMDGASEKTCCSYEDWSGEPKDTSFEIVDGKEERSAASLRCAEPGGQ